MTTGFGPLAIEPVENCFQESILADVLLAIGALKILFIKYLHRFQNDYPIYIEVYDGTSGDRDTGGNRIGEMPSRFEGFACHAALPDPGPWTPPYNYTLDPAESVPDLVQRCVGP